MKLTHLFVALAACLLLAACGPYQLTPTEQNNTELGALKFANAEGGSLVSCSGQDSDGDKYVTCTVKLSTGGTKPILCSYGAPGCKDK